jgi:hypothetical protein|tara:strand:- start:5425 stop:5622 length:198 start_codon:yes stop_codon:yes gene_type:complete
MFGVEIDEYFWKWVDDRVGSTITLKFYQGDITFTDGIEHKYSKPEILKGIQVTKIKNFGRWKPLT